MSYERRGDELVFESRRRAHPRPAFDATFAPRGDAAAAAPGSLHAFLAENYRFFAGDDPVYAGDSVGEQQRRPHPETEPAVGLVGQARRDARRRAGRRLRHSLGREGERPVG